MPTESALADTRILDFSSGPAGGLASTVLADFGAEVIKVEPPGGDRFRSMPSSAMWLRGKQSVTVDVADPEGRNVAHSLIATADVVLVSGSPARLERWGLDGPTLLAAHPDLVHCTLTGWGVRGPDAELPGYEGLVAAKAGRMAAFEVQLDAQRPVYAAVPVATHVASQAAVHGIVAALIARKRHGRGDLVETSLLQALMPFDLVDLLGRQLATRRGEDYVPLRKLSPMPTLNYHPLRTSDGRWIQCGNLLEHLFYSFLDATDLLGELLIDDRFQGSPAVWSPDAIEEVRDRMLVRMQERTADEWMSTFAANGNVAAEPIVDTQQALRHLDMVEGRGLIEVDDPRWGATTQVGPIADLEGTPGHVRAGAPRAGADNDAILATLTDPVRHENPTASADSSATADAGRPLAGVTILDLSTIIAAPLGMSMLADLGARVIKVEPLGGDPFRHLLTEGRMAVKTNLGKESICIDLKTDEGQAIIHRFVESADVLIHNFRGPVPAKLGIDPERLHAINPRLIWAVVNGYSPHGPGALRPATHPVIGAATGGVAYQAGPALTRSCNDLADVRENARQIMAANEANPDPNTSVVAASALLLALLAQANREAGQVVRINMQTANAWANADDFLTFDDKPARPAVDVHLHGLHACYRLYPAASGWVFLAATTDDEFRAFCDIAGAGGLASEPRFATTSARAEHDAELASELERLFAAHDADTWEALCAPAGVGCVRANDIEVDRVWFSSEQITANGWDPEVPHARFGPFKRWGPAVTVGGPNPDYRAAPLAGEHTDALLTEFGFTATEVERLRSDKIVASEAVEATDSTR